MYNYLWEEVGLFSIDFWINFIFVVLGFIIMVINIKKYSEIRI